MHALRIVDDNRTMKCKIFKVKNISQLFSYSKKKLSMLSVIFEKLSTSWLEKSTIDSNDDKFTIHFCDHKLKSIYLYLNFIFIITHQTFGKLARFFFEHPICACKSHCKLYLIVKKNVMNYYIIISKFLPYNSFNQNEHYLHK